MKKISKFVNHIYKINILLFVIIICTWCVARCECKQSDAVARNYEAEATEGDTTSGQTLYEVIYGADSDDVINQTISNTDYDYVFDVDDVPDYEGSPYAVINNNCPAFLPDEITCDEFEYYSDFDELGRCGTAFANISIDSMPNEERGEIGQIKPSGWHTVKYNDLIDGNYLYNRCHLIGYQLAGENANEKNLITGTRYLNVEGMLPFENQVAEYVRETNNHVLYRVTPVFEGDNLLASGVLMEAYSVEDAGEGVHFNVYCYNVQPSIEINYATGDSRIEEGVAYNESDTEQTTEVLKADSIEVIEEQSTSDENYILNTNTHKFHFPTCSSVDEMKDKNKMPYYGSREDIIEMGYNPCKRCNP